MTGRATRRTERRFPSANGHTMIALALGSLVLGAVGIPYFHGAVGMVESALVGLSEGDIVVLDDERKAAMVSNLLVELCSDKDSPPIANTGTLYN
jgi:hypothetical protein